MLQQRQRTTGYNCYPGCGWRRYGRLVVNFANHRITSIYFDGRCIHGDDPTARQTVVSSRDVRNRQLRDMGCLPDES